METKKQLDISLPSQQPPPPTNWWDVKHVLTYVFVLVCLGAIAYGIYVYLTPVVTEQQQVQTDPMSDWKTYANAEYGFEFKYPSDWVFKDFSNADTNPNTKINSVGITKNEANNDYSKFEVSSSESNLELGIGSSYSLGSEVVTGGIKWQMVQFNDGVPGESNLHDSLYLSTEHEGKFYSITLYPNDGLNINPIFDQILSTFKFTDSMAGWKTYSSTEYGFELKYPSDWKVANDVAAGEPRFSIYKSGEAPLTHHKNTTQVSIFPKGLGTEGPIGRHKTVTMNLTQAVEKSVFEYFTEDGEEYGYAIRFQTIPKSWESYGYVWGSTIVTSYSTVEECSVPCEGLPNLWVKGDVDENEMNTVKQIMSTFKFTK